MAFWNVHSNISSSFFLQRTKDPSSHHCCVTILELANTAISDLLLTEVSCILVKVVLNADAGFVSLKLLSSGFHLLLHLVCDEAWNHDLALVQGTCKVQLDHKVPHLLIGECLIFPIVVNSSEVLIAEKALLKQLQLLFP